MQKGCPYTVDFSLAFGLVALVASFLFLCQYAGNHVPYQPIPASHRLTASSRSFFPTAPGGENCSFEYDAEWLKSSSHYLHLAPDLQLSEGRQSPAGKKMCSDCSPTLLQTVEAVCS